jgi:CheY-like chemotaxis protein
MRVLVVDDDRPVVHLISHCLRGEGFTVMEANSAEEALALASGSEIDLLVTDIVMPGMSGRELAERLAGPGSKTRAILISGWCPEPAPHGARFLQKPFTLKTLLDEVWRVLNTPPRIGPQSQTARPRHESGQSRRTLP